MKASKQWQLQDVTAKKYRKQLTIFWIILLGGGGA
jgi:hypothetical protein